MLAAGIPLAQAEDPSAAAKIAGEFLIVLGLLIAASVSVSWIGDSYPGLRVKLRKRRIIVTHHWRHFWLHKRPWRTEEACMSVNEDGRHRFVLALFLTCPDEPLHDVVCEVQHSGETLYESPCTMEKKRFRAFLWEGVEQIDFPAEGRYKVTWRNADTRKTLVSHRFRVNGWQELIPSRRERLRDFVRDLRTAPDSQ